VLKIKERKLDASISHELKGEFLLLCRPSLKTLIVDMTAWNFVTAADSARFSLPNEQCANMGIPSSLPECTKKCNPC